MKTQSEIIKGISIIENEDIKVAKANLLAWFNRPLKFEMHEYGHPFDISFTGQTKSDIVTYDVEIKNCNLKNKLNYIWVRKDKLERMMKNKKNKRLIYIMFNLNNKEAYVINIDEINWGKIPCPWLKQYKCAYDKSQGMAPFPTYLVSREQTRVLDTIPPCRQ